MASKALAFFCFLRTLADGKHTAPNATCNHTADVTSLLARSVIRERKLSSTATSVLTRRRRRRRRRKESRSDAEGDAEFISEGESCSDGMMAPQSESECLEAVREMNWPAEGVVTPGSDGDAGGNFSALNHGCKVGDLSLPRCGVGGESALWLPDCGRAWSKDAGHWGLLNKGVCVKKTVEYSIDDLTETMDGMADLLTTLVNNTGYLVKAMAQGESEADESPEKKNPTGCTQEGGNPYAQGRHGNEYLPCCSNLHQCLSNPVCHDDEPYHCYWCLSHPC